MALLHLILWLIHAVTKALASAIVDVLTSFTGLAIAAGVVVLVFVSLGSAFGLSGLGLLWRRKREKP